MSRIRIVVEKHISGPPGITGRFQADICRHAVHHHIGDGPLERFVFFAYLLDINPVSPQQFVNPVFPPIICGVKTLESVDELLRTFAIACDDEVYMVGHQDERKHDYPRQEDGNGDIVHRHPEILPVPEPKTILQMVCRDQIIEFHSQVCLNTAEI